MNQSLETQKWRRAFQAKGTADAEMRQDRTRGKVFIDSLMQQILVACL